MESSTTLLSSSCGRFAFVLSISPCYPCGRHGWRSQSRRFIRRVQNLGTFRFLRSVRFLWSHVVSDGHSWFSSLLVDIDFYSRDGCSILDSSGRYIVVLGVFSRSFIIFDWICGNDSFLVVFCSRWRIGVLALIVAVLLAAYCQGYLSIFRFVIVFFGSSGFSSIVHVCSFRLVIFCGFSLANLAFNNWLLPIGPGDVHFLLVVLRDFVDNVYCFFFLVWFFLWVLCFFIHLHYLVSQDCRGFFHPLFDVFIKGPLYYISWYWILVVQIFKET